MARLGSRFRTALGVIAVVLVAVGAVAVFDACARAGALGGATGLPPTAGAGPPGVADAGVLLLPSPLFTAGFDPGVRLPADPAADAMVGRLAPGPVSAAGTDRGSDAALRAALARAAGRSRLAALGVHVRRIHVGRLGDGATVYARRADEPRILASNSKLFTTAAALDALGPGRLLETRLLIRGELRDGTLDGDLAVVGAGDPSFSWRLDAGGDPFAVFRAWAAALRRAGVERVEGRLYLDHSLFEPPVTHPDWDVEKRLKWYQVPVAALAFHENVVRVRVWPGARPGLPARVELEPALPRFGLQSHVLTAASWRGSRLLVHRPEGGGDISVAGAVFLRGGEVEVPVAVDDPVGYFGAAVVAALAEGGVELTGRTVPVAPRPGLLWQTAAVHRTALLDLLEVTNHESQNLFAESLAKLVGAERCGAGSWRRGVQAVEELAGDAIAEVEAEAASGEAASGEAADDPLAGFRLRDGSGLSRHNQATPRQVTAFLAAMARHPAAAAYASSLPEGGEEATSLEERFDEVRYRGHVFAKTGTLSGVSTLSGYARGRSGALYAFSVLTAGDVGRGRRTQDAVVRALVDGG
jgi:D-alanyl-D-alanine carboxypeptidase/D-alanyl-D-alanine-endopeptidase (penicillin-binding protein 4)